MSIDYHYLQLIYNFAQLCIKCNINESSLTHGVCDLVEKGIGCGRKSCWRNTTWKRWNMYIN